MNNIEMRPEISQKKTKTKGQKMREVEFLQRLLVVGFPSCLRLCVCVLLFFPPSAYLSKGSPIKSELDLKLAKKHSGL